MAVVLTLRTDADGNITPSIEGHPLAAPTAKAVLPDIARLRADPYTAGRTLRAALGGQELLKHLEADPDGLLLLDLDESASGVAWEYAALEDQHLFLGVRFGLLRLVHQSAPPAPAPGPLNFLALGADPLVDGQGEPPNDHLSIDFELKRIQSVLAESGTAIHAERVPPTHERLKKALRRATSATVLHLTCHGNVIETPTGPLAILQLEDDDGGPDLLNGDLLAGMGGRGVLRLVLLSACRTATGTTANLARALVRNGVPFAVGMQGDFPVDLSDELAEALYEPALAGQSLAEALRLARVELARAPEAVGLAVGYTGREGWRALPRQDGGLVGGLGMTWREALPPEVQPPRPLLGRDRELHALAALYSQGVKVVTVAGTGGMGKTALAAAFVERFGWRWPRGVAALSFASDRVDARTFRTRLLELLAGKAEAARHADADPDEQAGRVLALARDWDGLLLVDNYESVLLRLDGEAKADERVQAETVHRLLAQLAEGGSRLLLTSRNQPAGFRGERLFPDAEQPLSGLDAEPGAALFLQYSTRADKNSPTDRKLARDVWEATAGHPLAITLLAGEYDVSPVAPGEFLMHWVEELAAANRPGLSEHHRTFAAAFARSYDRLSAELQGRLLELSIFPFPFYPEGAALAWGLTTEGPDLTTAREALAGLSRQNLIEIDGWYKDNTPSAYRFQPALYREVTRRARENGQGEDKRGYAAYGAWLAQRGYGDINREPALARRCRLALDAMDAAVETLQGTERLWHVRRLAWIKRAFGENRPAYQLLRSVLPDGAPLPDVSPDPEAARVDSSLRYELARLAEVFGNLDEAMRLYQQSLKLTEQVGDLQGKSATLHAMANVFVTRGDLDGAMQLYEESLKLKEQTGNLQGKSATLHQMAGIYETRGDLDGAMQLYRESLKLKEQVGDLKGKSTTINQMAGIYKTRGDLDEAMRLYQESLKLKEQVGDLQGKSSTLHAMARIYETHGDLDGAMRLYDESLKLKVQLGDLQGKSATLHEMAGIYVIRGDLGGAMRLYEESLKLDEQLGDLKSKSATLHAMANVCVARGDPAGAMRLYQESLKLDEQVGYLQGKSETLGMMANVFMMQQQWDQAERTLEEALNLARALGQPAGIALSIVQLGQVAKEQRQRETALARYREGLAIFERLGMPRETEQVRQFIADLEKSPSPLPGPLREAIARARQAKEQGDLPAAAAAQEQAVALARSAGDDREALVALSILLYNLASYYSDLDRYPDAIRAFEEVVALDERTGHADLESDRRALEQSRQLAALSPEERARLRAGAQPSQAPANNAPVDPMDWATGEVQKAIQRGDLGTAVPAQKQVVALARDRGQTLEALELLRTQLIILANICLPAYRMAEAVSAYEEVVALDGRLNHADLAADRRGLEHLRQLAAMPEAERRAELDGMAAARQRARIENLADQARDAAIAVLRGQASVEEVVPQLERVAAQMEADEPPASPWREAAEFVRALVALLRGQPVPPVPAAYAGHLSAVQSAGSVGQAGA